MSVPVASPVSWPLSEVPDESAVPDVPEVSSAPVSSSTSEESPQPTRRKHSANEAHANLMAQSLRKPAWEGQQFFASAGGGRLNDQRAHAAIMRDFNHARWRRA